MGFFEALLAGLKEKKELKDAVSSLKRYGSIEGNGIPAKANFYLDDDKDRLIIEADNKRFLRAICYDDISEFKMTENGVQDCNSFAFSYCYADITTTNGEKFTAYQSFSIYKDPDRAQQIRELEGRQKMRFAILTFALKIKDEQTKKWANSIYEDEGLLPIFDEKGEFSFENETQNIELIKKNSI